MIELDAKLAYIAEKYDVHHAYGLPALGDLRTTRESFAEEIKQVFRDAGYKQWIGPDTIISAGIDQTETEIEYDKPGKKFAETEIVMAQMKQSDPVINITLKNIELTIVNDTYTLKQISAPDIATACVELEAEVAKVTEEWKSKQDKIAGSVV